MSTQASVPSLVVRTGEGERSLAAGRAYLVGRDPQADIVVADSRVSWHHAELRPGQRPLGCWPTSAAPTAATPTAAGRT